jgi:hypothetical protein
VVVNFSWDVVFLVIGDDCDDFVSLENLPAQSLKMLIDLGFMCVLIGVNVYVFTEVSVHML